MPQSLTRTLGLFGLFVYAVGDILGAGIYALIGKVAGVAGPLTWVAFAAAFLVALVTAFTYSELGTRFPKNGGAALFIHETFGREWLSQWVGWLVLWSGIVSLATASVAFAGYFGKLGGQLPEPLLILALLSLLGFVNFWGMRESSGVNMVCTVVELSGLLLVITLGLLSPATAGASDEVSTIGMPAILAGASLAFFAFVGFEDLVSVTEETKSPRKHLPIACIGGLGLAGVVFVLIAWIAPRVLPPVQLATSASPMVDLVTTARPGFPRSLFAAVALFAVANTALLNFVMASRLLHGMAKANLLPSVLGRLHRRRNTPYVAILLVYVLVALFALCVPLESLAATTSCLILTVFLFVHSSLLVLKRRKEATKAHFHAPALVPPLGIGLCATLLFFIPHQEQLAATGFAMLSLGFVIVARRFRRTAS